MGVTSTGDLEIQQGTTESFYLVWNDSNGSPINITGYSARLKIKPFPGSGTTILSLTESSGLTITGASGRIDVLITATQTAAMTFTTAYYDLEVESGAGVVSRLMSGSVVLLKEVTA